MMPGFQSFQALLAHCQEHRCSIAEAALAYEASFSGKSTEMILEGMESLLRQMRQTIADGVVSQEKSMSGLSGGDAARVMALLHAGRAPLGPTATRMIAYGVATLEENSRMKRIVACPTAGGSGSVPAVLIALEEDMPPWQAPAASPVHPTVQGLLTAGIIGEITARRIRLSGASAGCQAEVGVAAGMAAGGMVAMQGGTPEQVLSAAAVSMQNMMGLVCDPVAGLVEVPCVLRNGLSSVQAAAAATLALAGVKSFIPLDEVVDAMALVGRMMHPSLKETAEGGLAKTPTAQAFTKKRTP